MQSAALTANETARLKALYDYNILDTEAEKVFDDLTQLASEICGTPIALISLVDPNRQWFKSAVGLDATETSRDIAFCAHAINQTEIFQVEDALKDQRFFDNPLVIDGPKIRFYAGTPLITPEGHAIGTLCAIDSKPNKLSPKQANALEILGRNVISQMELRQKIKTLQTIDKNKTDFLSNMSHELRTPLNAIIGFSRLLLSDAANFNPKTKCLEYLKHIDYSGKRLLSVVNAILDINKIEAGMMTLELAPTDLRMLIQQVTGMLAVGIAEKDIDFQYHIAPDLPEILMLDEVKFSQIVINLLSNGIKYTPKNGKVRLNIGGKENILIIDIKDNGDGISADDQAELFTKFKQLGNTKNSQGSGLGLAITKGLVELMQGSINIKSEVQIGSVFTVTMPLILPPSSAINPTSTAIPEKQFSPNNLILVVEDNEINQAVIEAMLDTFSLRTLMVGSGEEALIKISQHKFNLVLMDIHLPGINGIETSHRLRHDYPDLPIVALSADSFEQEKMKKGESVFSDFLTKPVELGQLKKTLSNYLN